MKQSLHVESSPAMEQIAVFQEKIALSPMDLHSEVVSFDDILLKKLRTQLEGKCSKHGYVVPGSLELLSRSIGSSEKGRATADFLYYLKAQGKVYNPPDGLLVEGDVMLKNKMGCYVIIDNAIRVMIPRDLHIGNEDFDGIELNDRIKIMIKKSQTRANATHILSIGQFMGFVRKATATGAEAAEAATATADADAEEEVVSEGEQEEE